MNKLLLIIMALFVAALNTACSKQTTEVLPSSNCETTEIEPGIYYTKSTQKSYTNGGIWVVCEGQEPKFYPNDDDSVVTKQH
jgi:hypothetical protein